MHTLFCLLYSSVISYMTISILHQLLKTIFTDMTASISVANNYNITTMVYTYMDLYFVSAARHVSVELRVSLNHD